jgi:hypothetical protein
LGRVDGKPLAMRVSLTGLIGGLLGLLPFLALSVNLLVEGKGDNGEEIYVFVFGFAAVYAAAVGPIWLRPPVLLLAGVINLLAALASEWPFGAVFVPSAVLSFVGAFTSGRELARVWDK